MFGRVSPRLISCTRNPEEIEEVALYLSSLQGLPGHAIRPDIQDTFPEIKKDSSSKAGKRSP